MKIVIAGGSGQVGTILARHFHKEGHHVLVLSRRALVRHGLGGTNRPGTQFVSWIHEVDFIRAVEFLIASPSVSGPINLTSPHPLPNAQFLRILRKAWGVRFGLPSLPWMLAIGTFLLRTESELVLKSRRVVPGRLLDAGFAFNYPTWEQAAPNLVARARRWAL